MRRGLLSLFVGLGLMVPAVPAIAADPWVAPSDVAAAATDPDRFAWQLFIALTWPADQTSRQPASDRPYGDPGPVMFETWALSDQIFLPKAAQPPTWDAIPWSGIRSFGSPPVSGEIAQFRKIDPVAPGSASDQRVEVRFNRAAFDYIRDNALFSVEGQQWFYYNHQPISFPAGAIEVQAVWRPISEADKARYQWAEYRDAKTKRVFTYGLSALSVASKVLPRWFWATFEHVDNPYRSGVFDEGWLTPSHDSLACGAGPGDCNRAPTGLHLEGTRWENYRLRGAQVDYVDAEGNPLIVANSELETGFQRSSSCMSCHVRATVGPSVNEPASFTFSGGKDHAPASPAATHLSAFKTAVDGRVTGYTGVPQPDDFLLPGQPPGGRDRFLSLDSVWSLVRAQCVGK